MKLSGVVTTISGVNYPLGSGAVNSQVWIKAATANTQAVYLGNDGDDTITVATGYPLESGNSIIIYLNKLEDMRLISNYANMKINYLIVDGSRLDD